MIGVIIGDIAGSRFEHNNYRGKDFELFAYNSFFTDDSVMSIAVAKAILDCNGDYTHIGIKAIKYMQEYGRPYPLCGYGANFYDWIYSDNPKPYNSYGNGAAMRIAAAGFAGRSLDEVKMLSKAITEVSHNHPEGIKGAEATAAAVWLAANGYGKEEIKKHIQENYYSLDFTVDELRKSYKYSETCQKTVPEAIVAFLEAEDFEDAIRNAVSIGGDSDTLAAITGGMAEAFYGVPYALKTEAYRRLDTELLIPLLLFESKVQGYQG